MHIVLSYDAFMTTCEMITFPIKETSRSAHYYYWMDDAEGWWKLPYVQGGSDSEYEAWDKAMWRSIFRAITGYTYLEHITT